MMLSYCWTITPEDLEELRTQSALEAMSENSWPANWPAGAYIQIQGMEVYGMPGGSVVYDDGAWGTRYQGYNIRPHGREDIDTVTVLTLDEFPDNARSRPDYVWRGRVCIMTQCGRAGPDRLVLEIDGIVKQVVPASIAGLVVGAMGCFIFGLYLRAWLRERKALASEPPQDMIG
jgi:hypothetical protein